MRRTTTHIEAAAAQLDVHSAAFSNDEAIPARYTADGQNISPPLEWSGAPQQTEEFALIVDDPDAPSAEPFAHWLVYHLPASVTRLGEGAGRDIASLPQGAVHGRNSFGTMGYRGPAPPAGSDHHYHLTVYALDERIELTPGAQREDLLKAISGHVLARGEIVGTYRR